MNKLLKRILAKSAPVLNSKFTALVILSFVVGNYFIGKHAADMNLFAASGAIATTFGLLLMIQFTTIEKYIHQETIIASSTGMTGPPMSAKDAEEYTKRSIAAARIRLERELRSELKGLAFTVMGTIIWAYGAYF